MSHDDATRFDDQFRHHFEDSPLRSARRYEDVRHAYDFGREQALVPNLAGQSYADALETLKTRYGVAFEAPPYEEVADAVRFAFEETRRLHLHKDRESNSEGSQFLGDPDRGSRSLEETAAAMDVAPPPNVDATDLKKR